MSKSENVSLLGPALFVGLTLYTLVMQGQMPPDSNPSRNMDMRAARKVEVLDAGDYRVSQAHQAVVGLPLTQVSYTPNPNLGQIALNDAQLARQVPPAMIRVGLETQRPSLRFTELQGPVAKPASVDAPVAAPRPGRPDRAAPEITRPLIAGGTPAAFIPPAVPRAARRVSLPREIVRVTSARPEQAPNLLEQDYLIIVGENVHLRSGPGTWHPVLASISDGQRAILLESQGNWRRVTFPDLPQPNFGWMYERYLTPELEIVLPSE